MIGVHSPPPTGIEYAFQMPVLFEENRKRDSSAEKPAPRTPVTFMNCSIVYCFDGRALAVPGRADCASLWEAIAASATSATPARTNDGDMRTPLEDARRRAQVPTRETSILPPSPSVLQPSPERYFALPLSGFRNRICATTEPFSR